MRHDKQYEHVLRMIVNKNKKQKLKVNNGNLDL